MKTKSFLFIMLSVLIFFLGCSEESVNDSNIKDITENLDKTGFIEFKTLNPLALAKTSPKYLLPTTSNPSLTGDTTLTETMSLKLGIGDVWVSQGIVEKNKPDTLNWVRLTSNTNREIKLFEDYSFSAVEIPAGTYESIKITFRNVFYRYVKLISDPSTRYELLETMGSWTDACDENDTSWAVTNYFSADGNHKLNDNNLFEIASEGEKLGGFTIEEGKKAIVSWRLGAGVTATCVTYLIDENGNLEWDCGIDRMDFDCPPEVKYMWDFVVEYE